jgi:hypothetical protein
MHGVAIVFLILVAIFGLNVFRVVRWGVFGGIFAIIGLFILAQFLPVPKTAAQVTPTPSPTVELFDYKGFNN